VLDIAGYNRDNLSNASLRTIPVIDPVTSEQSGVEGRFTNADFGNTRGVDLRLDRRIGTWFNGTIGYSYQTAQSTGSDPFANQHRSVAGLLVTGAGVGPPPQAILPTSFSRPHTLTGAFSLTVPAGWRNGSAPSSSIANGGIVMDPDLVDAITSPDFRTIEQFSASEFGRAISTQTARTMTEMMVAGVDDGAASNARIDGVSVAGKTGTAENGEDDPYTLWFTGFAPADNPQYAITVLVEDGGGLGQEGFGNGNAAPVARQVLEAVLNK
jgi:hypothetical protein